MSHIMKKTTVRDLRYHFPEIEVRLNKGEEIVVHKRKKVVARLLPILPKADAYPDFSALRRRIFGGKKTRKTGTDLVSEERGSY
jgi:antitoxin (DNA-binding transcriptional repressor) of toxin-antitoxin stability system